MPVWNKMQYCVQQLFSKVQNYLYHRQQYKCENHNHVTLDVMVHFAEVQPLSDVVSYESIHRNVVFRMC